MRGRSERENTGVRVFGYETMMSSFIVKTGDELRACDEESFQRHYSRRETRDTLIQIQAYQR